MSDQELTSTIVSVERWLGNPLTRSLLKFMVAEDKCGNRLSNAIDVYAGTPHELCWKCELASWLVRKIMRRSSKLFDFDEQDIRNGLADPAYRRGMVNVLTGISRYGITRPQIVIAPFLVVWDFTHMCNLKCKHCYQDAQRAMEGEARYGRGEEGDRRTRESRGNGHRILGWGAPDEKRLLRGGLICP